MLSQVNEFLQKADEVSTQARGLANLAEKLSAEVAANKDYVADLDKKADQVREASAEIVVKRQEVENLQETIRQLGAQLASIKAGIPDVK